MPAGAANPNSHNNMLSNNINMYTPLLRWLFFSLSTTWFWCSLQTGRAAASGTPPGSSSSEPVLLAKHSYTVWQDERLGFTLDDATSADDAAPASARLQVGDPSAEAAARMLWPKLREQIDDANLREEIEAAWGQDHHDEVAHQQEHQQETRRTSTVGGRGLVEKLNYAFSRGNLRLRAPKVRDVVQVQGPTGPVHRYRRPTDVVQTSYRAVELEVVYHASERQQIVRRRRSTSTSKSRSPSRTSRRSSSSSSGSGKRRASSTSRSRSSSRERKEAAEQSKAAGSAGVPPTTAPARRLLEDALRSVRRQPPANTNVPIPRPFAAPTPSASATPVQQQHRSAGLDAPLPGGGQSRGQSSSSSAPAAPNPYRTPLAAPAQQGAAPDGHWFVGHHPPPSSPPPGDSPPPSETESGRLDEMLYLMKRADPLVEGDTKFGKREIDNLDRNLQFFGLSKSDELLSASEEDAEDVYAKRVTVISTDASVRGKSNYYGYGAVWIQHQVLPPDVAGAASTAPLRQGMAGVLQIPNWEEPRSAPAKRVYLTDETTTSIDQGSSMAQFQQWGESMHNIRRKFKYTKDKDWDRTKGLMFAFSNWCELSAIYKALELGSDENAVPGPLVVLTDQRFVLDVLQAFILPEIRDAMYDIIEKELLEAPLHPYHKDKKTRTFAYLRQFFLQHDHGWKQQLLRLDKYKSTSLNRFFDIIVGQLQEEHLKPAPQWQQRDIQGRPVTPFQVTLPKRLYYIGALIAKRFVFGFEAEFAVAADEADARNAEKIGLAHMTTLIYQQGHDYRPAQSVKKSTIKEAIAAADSASVIFSDLEALEVRAPHGNKAPAAGSSLWAAPYEDARHWNYLQLPHSSLGASAVEMQTAPQREIPLRYYHGDVPAHDWAFRLEMTAQGSNGSYHGDVDGSRRDNIIPKLFDVLLIHSEEKSQGTGSSAQDEQQKVFQYLYPLGENVLESMKLNLKVQWQTKWDDYKQRFHWLSRDSYKRYHWLAQNGPALVLRDKEESMVGTDKVNQVLEKIKKRWEAYQGRYVDGIADERESRISSNMDGAPATDSLSQRSHSHTEEEELPTAPPSGDVVPYPTSIIRSTPLPVAAPWAAQGASSSSSFLPPATPQGPGVASLAPPHYTGTVRRHRGGDAPPAVAERDRQEQHEQRKTRQNKINIPTLDPGIL
ncbi:unnamed protein product [Amoebophrya sp. A120]|nr:unnamed protein product [Amoebophrya sp. A120]|eukprot:GSA120T00014137001.1